MAQEIISYSDAKASGLARYFTGKPCAKGHVAERYTTNKTCSLCNARQAGAWLKSECGREYGRQWQAKPENREKRHAYADANADRLRAWHKEYRDANKERKRAWGAEYNQKNKDALRDKLREYRRQNPDQTIEHVQRRRARKLALLGNVTPGRRAELRKIQKGMCAYCSANLRKAGEHLDHIMPLALGGLHDDANLQLLCRSCNVRKSAKHPVTFAQENGLLL